MISVFDPSVVGRDIGDWLRLCFGQSKADEKQPSLFDPLPLEAQNMFQNVNQKQMSIFDPLLLEAPIMFRDINQKQMSSVFEPIAVGGSKYISRYQSKADDQCV